MRIRLVLFVIVSFVCTGLRAQVDAGDSLALVDLYNSTGGATSWLQKGNWLSKKPLASWYGIHVINNRVDSVQLDSNRLTGSIPVSFGNLTMLSYFSARQNSLSGKLPFSFTQLTNLTYLNLFWNDYLFIKLTPAFGRLRKLVYLNLSVTDLEGEIPDEIGKLTNLVHLDLGSGNLTGVIPQALGSLSRLTFLNLNGNKFTPGSGIPDTLANLTELDTLNLGYNFLGGRIPLWIQRLTRLRFLYLPNNNLTGSIPPELGKLKNLQSVNFDYNSLSGSLPVSLTMLTNLSDFSVHVNQLTGIISPQFGKLVNLAGLDLSVNKFTGTIPVELSLLSHLEYLFLNGNKLTGTIPDELGNMTQLSYLDLSVCGLSGRIPASLGNLMNLDYLNLANNKLEGTIPSSLSKLKRMEHFYLGVNQLTGEVPRGVLTLPRLYDVDLSRNRLTQRNNDNPGDSIIKIDELNLSDNQYTFNGLEYLVYTKRNWQYFDYSQQALIPVHLHQDKLALSAGGTLANNTYKWTKVGNATSQIITGDSTYQPSESGDYYASVTNLIAKDLTLRTDTIHYTAKQGFDMRITLSPNPASGWLTISGLDNKVNMLVTVADMSGYVWMKTMSRRQPTIIINVSRLIAGHYLLSVNLGNEIKTVRFIKE